MRLKGKEYEQRLSEFSKSTLVLISEIMPISIEISAKMSDITTNSELTEEEVVEQLKKLKEEYLKASQNAP